MKSSSCSTADLNDLPGYTGIEGVTVVGLSVDECARRIARFAAVKQSIVRLAAGRMTGVPEWELKALLGRAMWEDAIAYRDFDRRLRELRSNPVAVAKVLQYPLGDFLHELMHAPNSLALCVGWFDVLAPDFIAAMREYLVRTQPLVDQPSVRLLKQLITEEEERLVTGRKFVEVLARGRADDRADWRGHYQLFLEAAGGVWGHEVPTSFDRFALKPRAGEGEFFISREFRRDGRFKTTVPKISPPEFQGDELHGMIWTRSQEMTAAEMLASVVYEWDDLPVDAIVDLARHCWDEVRHSLFGCAAMEAEGHRISDYNNWIGYAHHTLPASPQKRYAHLAIATEAAAMGYPGGKRGEWEFCRDKARHPLMATFQDFDWADEVNHVGFGRKWLVEHYFKGDREEARKVADETMTERLAYYRQFDNPLAASGKKGDY